MTTMIRDEQALDLKTFSFNKEKKTLTAEASSLPGGAMREWDMRLCIPGFIHQLYDDSCDLGIAIRSQLTGKVELFYWAESEGRNSDYTGGYDKWVFRPIHKLANVFEITIFND